MTALGDLTWPEAGELAESVLAVPLGATEQHGPHLPLSTDTDVAVQLTGRLAEARPRVVMAPPLGYGSSGEHAGFPGTLSIGAAALELLLVELGRSAAGSFRHLLLVCAHGGNVRPVRAAVARLRGESRDARAWFAHWTGDAHAGRVETAMQLAIDDTRVHQDRAEPGNVRPIGELMPALRDGGVLAVSANGVLGDPTGATAAGGEALLDRLAADLIGAVDGWLAA